MATLQPGEKARMYALGAIARGGATRGGYVSGQVFISLDGNQIGWDPDAPNAKTMIASLTIDDALDETPNTCSLTVHGSVPTTGEDLIITLGSKNRLERLFAGVVLTVNQTFIGRPEFVQGECRAVDWTWLLGFHLVTKHYRMQSASAIAIDLIATYAAMNGFTTHGVEPNLPMLDEITFTNEELDQALTRLARRVGAYWKVDYLKDLRFGIDLSRNGNGDPETLTPAHRSFREFVHSTEETQALTRVYVEGRGSRLLSAVLAGESMIPIEAADMFAVASDVFVKVAFQGSEGGAQHLNFTGVDVGGAGSLVGPGAGPTNAPGAFPIVGTGLSAGIYQYAYTDTTASGETIPSPVATVNLSAGQIAAPTVKPNAVLQSTAGNVDHGLHSWAYTYISNGLGETTLSPLGDVFGNEAGIPATGGISAINMFTGGVLQTNKYYAYKVTYVGDAGGESIGAVYGATVFTGAANTRPQIFAGKGNDQAPEVYKLPDGVVQVKFYRTKGANSSGAIVEAYYYVGMADVIGGATYRHASIYDTVTDANQGPLIPTTDTARAKYGTIRITTSLSPAGGTQVRGIKLYRTAANTSSPYKLVAQLDSTGGAVSWDDSTPDSALGAQPPGTNTAGNEYRAVSLGNISPGPPSTTSRKVYRTIANGPQLKLLTTLADNTTTTFTDTIGDGSLGANAPTGDTSGLQVPAGQVPAGSTSMVVANAGAFPAAGWVVIGNGEQVIRFTSKTATTLTGIPETGVGSITAGVAYNSTATAAPMLTGIPATGTRSIQRALTSGDEVYLVVQCDNVESQDAIEAALEIPDGIREEWVQDRRLSIPEARARGEATLKTRPLRQQRLRYTSRDLRTASGKNITINLPAPTNLQGTYKIQQVTISNFRPHATQYPTFTVEASSSRFSFEDWLRVLKTKE